MLTECIILVNVCDYISKYDLNITPSMQATITTYAARITKYCTYNNNLMIMII